MAGEVTTERHTDAWGDLGIATLRRGLLTHRTRRSGVVTGAAADPDLLAVLDDGSFVVADGAGASRVVTVRVMAARDGGSTARG
jgi:hypothetical protein